MTTKPRQQKAAAPRRPISITAVVDCVGALAAGNTRGHVYLYDTNKAGGSAGLGTEQLRTRVTAGDQLLWNVLALECEAFVAIDGIEIDKEVCEPVRKVYPGTDVSYWIGTVKKSGTTEVPYQIRFKLGTRDEPLTTALSPALVG
ncbi:hypothetical protein GCM10018793_60940 [Streptomyces sulfonofaciens]|uniref:Uncharacterized protein n=1 Tax=Streptomyces sulfonofaciens TaxID=68272 RepID=A0A919GM49_9ACTN|nr:hypothetical protein [Streptomyces sulfonofaciens]GHH86976.1 hypothetical protein GCM10018793_60940 [Streptomyces sulfonofaciens]